MKAEDGTPGAVAELDQRAAGLQGLSGADVVRKGAHRLGAVERRHGKIESEHALDAGAQAQCLQGMAAGSEEIMVDAECFHTEQVAPQVE